MCDFSPLIFDVQVMRSHGAKVQSEIEIPVVNMQYSKREKVKQNAQLPFFENYESRKERKRRLFNGVQKIVTKGCGFLRSVYVRVQAELCLVIHLSSDMA